MERTTKAPHGALEWVWQARWGKRAYPLPPIVVALERLPLVLGFFGLGLACEQPEKGLDAKQRFDAIKRRISVKFIGQHAPLWAYVGFLCQIQAVYEVGAES